jgi:hypothetical protein
MPQTVRLCEFHVDALYDHVQWGLTTQRGDARRHPPVSAVQTPFPVEWDWMAPLAQRPGSNSRRRTVRNCTLTRNCHRAAISSQASPTLRSSCEGSLRGSRHDGTGHQQNCNCPANGGGGQCHLACTRSGTILRRPNGLFYRGSIASSFCVCWSCLAPQRCLTFCRAAL